MGMNESTIKSITDPINHLIDNCGKSNCHSKCGGGCFELDVENQVQQLPVGNSALPLTVSRESESTDSVSSNVTKIVEIHEKPNVL